MAVLKGLLDGVRVIDLTMNLSGPYGAMLLADLGAEVIKVEPPRGDPQRTLIPMKAGLSVLYAAINRNKRSITIDLRTEAGKNLLLKMVAQSDVVFNNYRPGVLDRLGLGLDVLKRHNPKIVLCSLTGYGLTGPHKDWPAYDVAIQAVSGGMSVTGYPGEPPARAGIPIADLAGGLFSALAIVAGLRRRDADGDPVELDISMLDTQISMLMYWASIAMNTENIPVPQGSGNTNVMPYGAFECSDGYLVIAIWGESFWPKLCRAVGRPDLAENEKYSSNTLRVKHRAELQELFDKAMASRPRDEWLAILREHDIPCAPINDVRQAMNDDQVIARGMRIKIDVGEASLEFAGNPIRTVPEGPVASKPPPRQGQHTREILAQFGVSDVDADKLVAEGVVHEER
jgi:crotonobetainyl-CoA:carnitine CoA-transferase CaiB-like acyl-CoA transferase